MFFAWPTKKKLAGDLNKKGIEKLENIDGYLYGKKPSKNEATWVFLSDFSWDFQSQALHF